MENIIIHPHFYQWNLWQCLLKSQGTIIWHILNITE